MAIIGLTGGIGSGKSVATRFFEELAITCVDMDVVARDVVQPNRPAFAKILDFFSPSIPDLIAPTGQLNRKALREHIFHNPNAKSWLEQLLHPIIRDETYAQLQNNQTPYGVLVSPLLLEKNITVDAVIVVDVELDMQLKRVMGRDNTDMATTQKIIAAQLSREKRLLLADYVIDNSGSLEHARAQVAALHQLLLERFG